MDKKVIFKALFIVGFFFHKAWCAVKIKLETSYTVGTSFEEFENKFFQKKIVNKFLKNFFLENTYTIEYLPKNSLEEITEVMIQAKSVGWIYQQPFATKIPSSPVCFFATQQGVHHAAQVASQYWFSKLNASIKSLQKNFSGNKTFKKDFLQKKIEDWMKDILFEWEINVDDKVFQELTAYYVSLAKREKKRGFVFKKEKDCLCDAKALTEQIKKTTPFKKTAIKPDVFMRTPLTVHMEAFRLRLDIPVLSHSLNARVEIDFLEPYSMISPSWFTIHGLNLFNCGFNIKPYMTYSNSSKYLSRAYATINQVILPQVLLGGRPLKDMSFLSLETQVEQKGCCDAVLGLDFLQNYVMEIDLWNMEVRFFEPKLYAHPADKKVFYVVQKDYRLMVVDESQPECISLNHFLKTHKLIEQKIVLTIDISRGVLWYTLPQKKSAILLEENLKQNQGVETQNVQK